MPAKRKPAAPKKKTPARQQQQQQQQQPAPAPPLSSFAGVVPFQRDTLLADPERQWQPLLLLPGAVAMTGVVHPLPAPNVVAPLAPFEMENALQLLPPPPVPLLTRLRRLLAKKGMSHLLRRSRYQHLVQTFGQGTVSAAWLTLLLAPHLQRSNIC